MKKTSRARLGTALATVTAATALVAATAGSAQAAEHKVTSDCDVTWINCANEPLLMLFYNSKELAIKDGSYTSSWAQFYGNVSDYTGTSQYQGSTLTTFRYVFNGSGTGSWQYMKNNAASVQNCSGTDAYRVYFNSGYGGTSQYFQKREPYGSCPWSNLISALKNENASQHFA
ncbi:hypothetical protein Slala04_34430 [Streptomyces lavendulae subsp. lavendulae]|nr:hypothetical protein Slala04_34430 [Streptomyces lavendulae subsp. lavendulae]